jgi:uncharacterized protein DUF6221
MSETLTSFLLARIADDEDDARYATERGLLGEGWDCSWAWQGVGQHESQPRPTRSFIVEGAPSPDRVLAECEARRRIVELHQVYNAFPDVTACGICGESPYCATLRTLAAVYVDHQDYRKEWKP